VKVITDRHIAFLISNFNHNVVILMVQETKVEYDNNNYYLQKTASTFHNGLTAKYESISIL
jgi:hypothetical protein